MKDQNEKKTQSCRIIVGVQLLRRCRGRDRLLGCVDISSEPYESTDEVQESQETR